MEFFQKNFQARLARQAQLHPALQPRDAEKFCYQAAFGGEHLLTDPAGAGRMFDEEFAAVAPNDGPLWEPVADGVCRVNLAPWKQRELPGAWLFRLFALSDPPRPDAPAVLEQALQAVNGLAAAGGLPFFAESWARFLHEERENCTRPTHHSAAYRAAERPHYRVVSGKAARLLPLLPRLADLLKETPKNKAAAFALDGRAASGKTTMAAQLARVTGAGVVHMDDFFLPAALRTQRRLSEPGGNVHVERFRQEILPRLSDPRAFCYRAFDCGQMKLGGEKAVPASGLRLVEGAYSCHPALGNYMKLRVFSDVAPAEQLRRLRARDPARAEDFVHCWIPMEETYFRAFSIRERADLIL